MMLISYIYKCATAHPVLHRLHAFMRTCLSLGILRMLLGRIMHHGACCKYISIMMGPIPRLALL